MKELDISSFAVRARHAQVTRSEMHITANVITSISSTYHVQQTLFPL